MKPITINEVLSLQNAKQNFRDCYLVSAVSALTHTPNGRRILQNNIQKDGNNYCIKFNNVYGKPETYLVKGEECDQLILTDKYLEPVPLERPHHPIIKAIEVAMNKLLTQHPYKKPFICKIPECREKFEFNKVSNFFKMFTGISPITVNESGLKMTLLNNSDVATDLFERMRMQKDVSFVMGSGYKALFDDLPHCWTVSEIYPDRILTFDNRRQTYVGTNYEQSLHKYKFICGYFNEMLK